MNDDRAPDEVETALADLGYYYGETHYYDPNKATTCWLRSDGAGSAVPVSDEEAALIKLLLGTDGQARGG